LPHQGGVLEYDEELEYDVEVLLEIIWTLLGVVCLSLFVPYKRQEGASLCFFRPLGMFYMSYMVVIH
jgi:hypothetical protein